MHGQIVTRTKSLPPYLALEAMAQTCGMHLRHLHDFRIQAYLVSVSDLLYAPDLGVEPLTIRADITAETTAGASYAVTVNDAPACRILIGRHAASDSQDTIFQSRFRMPEHNFLERLKSETEARRQAGLGRELLPVTEYHGSSVVLDGRAYLNFSSNDFLGLAQDRELAETLAQLCRRCGRRLRRLASGPRARPAPPWTPNRPWPTISDTNPA